MPGWYLAEPHFADGFRYYGRRGSQDELDTRDLLSLCQIRTIQHPTLNLSTSTSLDTPIRSKTILFWDTARQCQVWLTQHGDPRKSISPVYAAICWSVEFQLFVKYR